MSFPTLLGLTGISLLLSVISLYILLFLGLKKQTAYSGAILILVLSFMPISGYSINQYVRGLFNDLSISSLVLMGYYFITPDNSKSQSRPMLSLIAVTGIFFYPAALGLGPVDPYAWGFLNSEHGLVEPLAFLTILACLMWFAFRQKHTVMLVCLALSALAYQLGMLESRNIWDYLLDPVIFFYALLSWFKAKITTRNFG